MLTSPAFADHSTGGGGISMEGYFPLLMLGTAIVVVLLFPRKKEKSAQEILVNISRLMSYRQSVLAVLLALARAPRLRRRFRAGGCRVKICSARPME